MITLTASNLLGRVGIDLAKIELYIRSYAWLLIQGVNCFSDVRILSAQVDIGHRI